MRRYFLVLTFDATLFQPTWSGQLEIRFTTEDACELLALIEARMQTQK